MLLSYIYLEKPHLVFRSLINESIIPKNAPKVDSNIITHLIGYDFYQLKWFEIT